MQSDILFMSGLLILILQIILLYSKDGMSMYILFMVISVLLITLGWIYKNISEKYPDYNYAKQTGKLVSGTVFASYPENAPGLGWII